MNQVRGMKQRPSRPASLGPEMLQVFLVSEYTSYIPACVTRCAHFFCSSLSRHSRCVFVGTRRSIKGRSIKGYPQGAALVKCQRPLG